MILKKIVSHNKATVMADALCVINTYRHLREVDAYFYRTQYLLTTRYASHIYFLSFLATSSPSAKSYE